MSIHISLSPLFFCFFHSSSESFPFWVKTVVTNSKGRRRRITRRTRSIRRGKVSDTLIFHHPSLRSSFLPESNFSLGWLPRQWPQSEPYFSRPGLTPPPINDDICDNGNDDLPNISLLLPAMII